MDGQGYAIVSTFELVGSFPWKQIQTCCDPRNLAYIAVQRLAAERIQIRPERGWSIDLHPSDIIDSQSCTSLGSAEIMASRIAVDSEGSGGFGHDIGGGVI